MRSTSSMMGVVAGWARPVVALFLCLGLTACDDAADSPSDAGVWPPLLDPAPFEPPDLTGWDGATPPVLVAAPLPEGIDTLDATYYTALSCGPHPENLFDLVVPNGIASPPLLVYSHGGGFYTGSRLDSFENAGNAADVVDYVNDGLAYATVDYRFLGPEGVRKPLQDVQVCLQYMRYHAAELGFDPDRIMLAGASAGAGTSLWLATIDDLALPAHANPILRQSTRVSGVMLRATQATYDVLRWDPDVFSPEFGTVVQAAIALGFDGYLLNFYGAPDIDALQSPYYADYRLTVDMLAWMSSDDPPIWVYNSAVSSFPGNQNQALHHAFHARAVVDYADAFGVETVAHIPALGIDDGEDKFEFARRVLLAP